MSTKDRLITYSFKTKKGLSKNEEVKRKNGIFWLYIRLAKKKKKKKCRSNPCNQLDYWILENPTNSKLENDGGGVYSLDYLRVGPCFCRHN